MSKRAFLLILLVVCLATLSAVALMEAGADTLLQGVDVPPPPPTPGPPPAYVYEALPGEPVKTAEMAIKIALEIDMDWTLRETPLSVDTLVTNPSVVGVEQYATRQEAEDIYSGGGSDIPEIAFEPVWVVRIKGKVPVRVIGGIGRLQTDGHNRSGFEEADGVTYMISQRTGQLLAVTSSSQTLAERQRALGK